MKNNLKWFFCFGRIVAAWAMVCICSFANAAGDWFHFQEAIMGTEINVELFEPNNNAARAKEISDQVMQMMRHIDNTMSPWIEASDVAQANRWGGEKPVKIGEETFGVIKRSFYYSDISHGAFDISFASIGYKYDYRKHLQPTESEITAALPLINYKAIILDEKEHTIKFAHPGMRIDLGGIAKGYSVDRGVEILKRNGIEHGMVNAGGDSFVLGDRFGRPWYVGIKNPRGEGTVIKLPISNLAISTSGDYERYFEQGGKRVHHIINPKTGRSATGIISVSVLADKSETADGLTKPVFIMGVEEGLKLINGLPNVSAIIIDAQGKVHYSNDLVGM